MLLLTVHEWIGPQRNKMLPEQAENAIKIESIKGLVTKLPLSLALKHLKDYSNKYKERYLLAVEFSLLATSQIQDLNEEDIRNGNLQLVEDFSMEDDDE